MSASGHSMVGRAPAPEAAGGRVPADDEHLIHSPEAAEEAVWAARAMLLQVFKRAHSCSRPKCRRKGTCLAGWGSKAPQDSERQGGQPSADPDDAAGAGAHPLFAPTGGCPVMTEAEWEVVQLGVICQRMLLGELLHAMEAAEEDGRMPPSFAAQPGRKTVPWPLSWAEWLTLDPGGRLKDFERESAEFAGDGGSRE